METKDMLKKVLRRLNGPLNQFFENLAGDYGETWLKEFKKFLRKEPCWGDVKIISKSFDFLSTVDVPAAADEFVVKEHFAVNMEADAQVKIFFIGNSFRDKLFNKVEGRQRQKKLCFYNLSRLLYHKAIIDTFTQSHCIFETTIRDVWTRIKKQAHGEQGELMVSGRENVFCAKLDGQLSFVIVYWDCSKKGWGIEEEPVNPQHGCFTAGARFFIQY